MVEVLELEVGLLMGDLQGQDQGLCITGRQSAPVAMQLHHQDIRNISHHGEDRIEVDNSARKCRSGRAFKITGVLQNSFLCAMLEYYYLFFWILQLNGHHEPNFKPGYVLGYVIVLKSW